MQHSSGSQYSPSKKSLIDGSNESDSLSDTIPEIPDISRLLNVIIHDLEDKHVSRDGSAELATEVPSTSTNMDIENNSQNNADKNNCDSEVDATVEMRPSVPTTRNVTCRVYDKKFYCLYCGEPKCKLKDHILAKHHDEEDVAKFNTESTKKEKDKIYEKIRNLGNHLHNIKVLQEGKGELSVRYRPTDGKAHVDDYGPCPYCYGYFIRRELWRHRPSCKLKPETVNQTKEKMAVTSRLLLPCTGNSSTILGKVINSMKADDISRIAKSDSTIMAFGEKLCKRHGHDDEQHNYIRQKMREMARLLKEIRAMTHLPNTSLAECLHPQYFNTIVQCSRNIAGFDSSANRYGTPSLALKIGHSLQKCLKIVIGRSIEVGNNITNSNAEKLQTLIDLNWTDEVSSNALKTLQEGKRNKGSRVLPLADDVKLLSDHLKSESKKQYMILNESNEKDAAANAWVSLSQILLTQLVCFNRRRAGEVSKMKMSDYSNIQSENTEKQFDSVLTEFEKQLCKSIKRIEIEGKRGRTVPILFPASMEASMDLLNSKRNQMVQHTNPYLFPRTHYGSMSHIRATDSMRKFADDCGAAEPDRLRSTKLRKQMSTMSQIMNLKDNELDILANFLGHDIRVHREFYRLPEGTIQVAKVSKLLLQMDKGSAGLRAGQSLDDIELEDGDDDDSSDGKDIDVISIQILYHIALQCLFCLCTIYMRHPERAASQHIY